MGKATNAKKFPGYNISRLERLQIGNALLKCCIDYCHIRADFDTMVDMCNQKMTQHQIAVLGNPPMVIIDWEDRRFLRRKKSEWEALIKYCRSRNTALEGEMRRLADLYSECLEAGNSRSELDLSFRIDPDGNPFDQTTEESE